jgi:hypothetical protein
MLIWQINNSSRIWRKAHYAMAAKFDPGWTAIHLQDMMEATSFTALASTCLLLHINIAGTTRAYPPVPAQKPL